MASDDEIDESLAGKCRGACEIFQRDETPSLFLVARGRDGGFGGGGGGRAGGNA